MTSRAYELGIEFMMMKAAVPKPDPGEVLVKVNEASICGTDVKAPG